jgi:hypothetical protein
MAAHRHRVHRPPSVSCGTVRRRRLVHRVAALLAAATIGGVLAVYAAHGGDSAGPPTGTSTVASTFALSTSSLAGGATPSDSPVTSPASPPSIPPTDLEASFEESARTSSATVGMVVTPVGRGGPTLRLGDWSYIGPAWSTIKVPLAIAAVRRQTSDPSLVEAAIIESDNAAADQLWTDLGGPETASGHVEEVLSMAGDTTEVEAERVRPGFSAFGQTRWPLPEQAVFMSNAVCDPSSDAIVDLMGRIAADQRWGLGVLPEARFKGGWGPSLDGAYLVRQMGVVDTPAGRVAVAMTALPSSGTFADGTAALTSIAKWLAQHVGELPSGECP